MIIEWESGDWEIRNIIYGFVAVWLTLYKYLFAHTRDVVGTPTPATSGGAKVASARAPATVIIIRPALQKTRGAKRRDSSLISAYGRNPLSLPVGRCAPQQRAVEQIRFTLLLARADHYPRRRRRRRGRDKTVYVRFVQLASGVFSIRRANANSPRQLRDYSGELIKLR